MVILGGDWDAVLTSSDTPEFTVGTRGCDQTTGKEYIYVTASAAVTATNCVVFAASYSVSNLTTAKTAAATAQGALLAVAVVDIAADGYGWVQIFGESSVNVATSCAAFTQLCSTTTAGRIDDATPASSAELRGIITIGAESSNAADCFLQYPYVSNVTN